MKAYYVVRWQLVKQNEFADYSRQTGPEPWERVYRASEVDARIALLQEPERMRVALSQIATGAAEERDGLTYIEIAEIASAALTPRVTSASSNAPSDPANQTAGRTIDDLR